MRNEISMAILLLILTTSFATMIKPATYTKNGIAYTNAISFYAKSYLPSSYVERMVLRRLINELIIEHPINVIRQRGFSKNIA